MGFGLFYGLSRLLGIGAVNAASSISDSIKDDKARREVSSEPTYRDSKGLLRLRSNNHSARISKVEYASGKWWPLGLINNGEAHSGDECIVDMVTMTIVKNITRERREEEAKRKRENGETRTVYWWVNESTGRMYYRDLSTREIVYDRYINGCCYYFGSESLKILRKADKQIEREKMLEKDAKKYENDIEEIKRTLEEQGEQGEFASVLKEKLKEKEKKLRETKEELENYNNNILDINTFNKELKECINSGNLDYRISHFVERQDRNPEYCKIEGYKPGILKIWNM